MKMAVLRVSCGLIFLFILSVYAQKDNNPNCSCYVVSHSSPPSYFLYHRFQDFRSIPSTASNNYANPPALLTSKDRNGVKPVTSPFLESDAFENSWEIETWSQGTSTDSPVSVVNSPQNVYICTFSSPQPSLRWLDS